MASYAELLTRTEWKARREQILELDGYKCVRCNNREDLHVHHIRYERGRMPWEHKDHDLVTLCEQCHTVWHNRKNGGYLDVEEFFRTLDIDHRARLRHE